MSTQPEFGIGDVVYKRDDSKSARSWFIIGIVMRPCYDLIAWEYYIGHATYGDYPMSSFGNRCDVDTSGPHRFEQLVVEADWIKLKKERLATEIATAEAALTELKKQFGN